MTDFGTMDNTARPLLVCRLKLRTVELEACGFDAIYVAIYGSEVKFINKSTYCTFVSSFVFAVFAVIFVIFICKEAFPGDFS